MNVDGIIGIGWGWEGVENVYIYLTYLHVLRCTVLSNEVRNDLDNDNLTRGKKRDGK